MDDSNQTNRGREHRKVAAESGIPDTGALADDRIATDLANPDQALQRRGETGTLHTASIGRAWTGPVKSANLGDDGSLGDEENIDTSGTGPADVPDLGNIDHAGTGNAGYTGDNVTPTELDRARK